MAIHQLIEILAAAPPFMLVALGLASAALVFFDEEVATATLFIATPLAFALQFAVEARIGKHDKKRDK